MKQKKWITGLAALAVAFSAAPAAFADMEEQEIRVFLDGAPVSFDAAPMICNGRTFVPLRALGNALGASVEWEGETQEITLTQKDVTNVLQIGSQIAVRMDADGTREHMLEAAPFISKERTMVPLRFLSEAYDKEVVWDGEARTVMIFSKTEFTAEGKPIPNLAQDTDGALQAIHATVRSDFEQETLPQAVLADPAAFRNALSGGQETVQKWIDDLWLAFAGNTFFGSGASQADEQALQAQLRKTALRPRDVYAVTLETLADGTQLVLLNLADMDALPICSYIAVTCPTEGDLRYIVLENSFNNVHLLCEAKQDSHTTYQAVENKKDTFLEAVRALLAEEITRSVQSIQN